MNIETRVCYECGEEWVDGGETACIFCGSENTAIIEPEDEDEGDV